MTTLSKLKAPSLEECLQAADETQGFCLQKDGLREIPMLLRSHYQGRAVYLIADENTYEAAGKQIRNILEDTGIGIADTFIISGKPRLHADYEYVKVMAGRIKNLPDYKTLIPLAIGAGTINDLVKRASFEINLPYLCVPTAASVDGYTSTGAALLEGGFKHTLPCPAPLVVAADTNILSGAPSFLSSSGFGDLAGKITAGTDWFIADKAGTLGAPGTEPIDPKTWSMTQTGLSDALHRSVDAVRGDTDGVQVLFRALSITGFAMQYLKSSRPVSGCEHLYSHVWEMEDLSCEGIPVTHGHKVAMGTLAATAFTELLFSGAEAPSPARDYKRPSPGEREAEVRAAFKGYGAEESIVKTAEEKMANEKNTAALIDGLRDSWQEIREKVLSSLFPYEELRELLKKGGCPVLPESINLTRSKTIATARKAQMIRNRYTVLDLAWDLGVFESVLNRMETSDWYLR
jgi:glycerol-1-phosphate dehydrogenase [NAD(P)+]